MADGITTEAFPETRYIPPHEPVYQYQLAPVPEFPPLRLKVDEFPAHIGDMLFAEIGAMDKVLVIIVVLTQFVVLHRPSALT